MLVIRHREWRRLSRWLLFLIIFFGLVGYCVPMPLKRLTDSSSPFASRTLSSNSAESRSQNLGSPSDLAWQAWLLLGSQTGAHSSMDSATFLRRITPKSVFIAPAHPALPPCADGYRADTMGRCVKSVNIDHEAHLDFLLQRLNNRYANRGGLERPNTNQKKSTGPLQLNIPLVSGANTNSYNVHREETGDTIKVPIVITAREEVLDISRDASHVEEIKDRVVLQQLSNQYANQGNLETFKNNQTNSTGSGQSNIPMDSDPNTNSYNVDQEESGDSMKVVISARQEVLDINTDASHVEEIKDRVLLQQLSNQYANQGNLETFNNNQTNSTGPVQSNVPLDSDANTNFYHEKDADSMKIPIVFSTREKVSGADIQSSHVEETMDQILQQQSNNQYANQESSETFNNNQTNSNDSTESDVPPDANSEAYDMDYEETTDSIRTTIATSSRQEIPGGDPNSSRMEETKDQIPQQQLNDQYANQGSSERLNTNQKKSSGPLHLNIPLVSDANTNSYNVDREETGDLIKVPIVISAREEVLDVNTDAPRLEEIKDRVILQQLNNQYANQGNLETFNDNQTNSNDSAELDISLASDADSDAYDTDYEETTDSIKTTIVISNRQEISGADANWTRVEEFKDILLRQLNNRFANKGSSESPNNNQTKSSGPLQLNIPLVSNTNAYNVDHEETTDSIKIAISAKPEIFDASINSSHVDETKDQTRLSIFDEENITSHMDHNDNSKISNSNQKMQPNFPLFFRTATESFPDD